MRRFTCNHDRRDEGGRHNEKRGERMATNPEEQGTSDQRQPQLAEASASGAGLLDALLRSGDILTLRDALTAWQREQDRLLNRSWRRPGGLARPAGL